jgi:hypothetical protein
MEEAICSIKTQEKSIRLLFLGHKIRMGFGIELPIWYSLRHRAGLQPVTLQELPLMLKFRTQKSEKFEKFEKTTKQQNKAKFKTASLVEQAHHSRAVRTPYIDTQSDHWSQEPWHTHDPDGIEPLDHVV